MKKLPSKKTAGRPRLSIQDRKSKMIAFRVETDERELFQLAADASNLKLSDWIRQTLIESINRIANS